MSGSGISWAICKSTSRSRQITMPAPHHKFFYRPDALPAAQPTVSKQWRQSDTYTQVDKYTGSQRLHCWCPLANNVGKINCHATPKVIWLWVSQPSVNTWFDEPQTALPKRHLDRLSQLCRSRGCIQQTRHTDHGRSVTIGSILGTVHEYDVTTTGTLWPLYRCQPVLAGIES